MSSPPRQDIDSLVRGLLFTNPPGGDSSPQRQGGFDKKTGGEEDLMDFSTMIAASISKPTPMKTETRKTPVATIDESIFSSTTIGDTSSLGTSGVVSLTSVDHKKYWSFVAPPRTSECDMLCRQFIGQGATFCVMKNCNKVHRGKTREKANVDVDQLFVLKNKGVVFSEPTVDAIVEEELLNEWTHEPKTLSEWVELFSVANKSTGDGVEVKNPHFTKKKLEHEKAKHYETPARKRVRDTLEEEDAWEFTGFDLEANIDQKLAMTQMALLENQKDHSHFRDVHLELEDSVRDVSFAQEYNTEHLKLKIGKKPKCLSEKYDGPSIYSTIGAIAAELNELPNSFKSKLDSEKASQQVDLEKFKRQTEIEMQQLKIEYTSAFANMKNAFVASIGNLKSQIDEVGRQSLMFAPNMNVDIDTIVTKVEQKMQSNMSSQDVEMNPEFEEKINDKLMDISDEIKKLKSNSAEVISFHQLGFRGPDEADSWVEEHCPSGRYGLVVDFHTMMEHIYQKIKGIDALARLEKVHKIQVGSNSEAVAIASFEVMVPRFFTKPGEHEVVEDEESYFTNIKGYKEWDNPSSGHRYILEKQIERFQNSHISVIRKKLSAKSQMYHVALDSLTTTVAWATRFFSYVDKTFKTYAEGKFGPDKAWHVATKLATALLLEMSKPREGTFDSLESGAENKIFNARVVFYNTLRALDIMNEISECNFQDHPAVSQELVKFLSLNTSVEAVDTLTSKMKVTEAKVSSLESDTKGAVKTAATVGNRCDTLATQLKDVMKRVVKLEK